MLADSHDIPRFGALDGTVQLPDTFRHELLDFIADQLPRWRDRPDRPAETSETILTSQLCGHLNSAARNSYLDFLQFRTEEPDERHKNRKIDLIPSGCGCALLIDGRTYSDFEPLMPIECKRLPTPKGPKRDEREYVFSDQAGVGGIQRFKAGLHGGCHTFAAMIGYVQSGTSTQWKKRVSDWITAIINTGTPGWAVADLLQSQSDDKVRRLSVLHSTHQRVSMQPIRLRHLWVEMN